MDGPVQGLVELELLQRRPHPVTVPGAMIPLQSLLSRASDGPNYEAAKREESRLTTSLSKEVGEHMYSIAARKTRHRPAVQKKYTQLLQRVTGQPLTSEAKLRILRSYRLRLLHEFCQQVLKEAYHDSVSIQTLLACRQLRRYIALFPPEAALFRAGLASLQEHLPRAVSDSSPDVFMSGPITPENSGRPQLEDLLRGRP